MFITEIAKISAREIYDSRGNPTIETTVQLRCGARGVASVPSGASTGAHEAWELRDGGDRLMGRGVLQAVSHVEGEIAQTLIGKSPLNQRRLDETLCQMDGTENLSRLGANAILSVSMACARAAAAALHLPLYRYLGGLPAGKLPGVMMNVLNGGVHAANNVDIQEFMLTPVSAGSVQQAVRMGVEVYHALKSLLLEKGLSASVGDEGGFAPDIPGDEDALVLLEEAVRRAGMIPGQDVCFSLDAAASGWQDAYVLAETKDEGITVGGNIDGWREGKVEAMRIDFVFSREMPAPRSSRVIFNGTFYPVISDHFGVLTEW